MKDASCSVENCTNTAIRSLSKKRILEAAEKLGLKIVTARSGRARRAYLCKAHYKQIKKELRNKEKLERMRYGS
ncbi:MAG: hypothetical protein ACE5I5_03895 [Candidatus Heimdallarchaeota archaeon]